MVITEVFGSKVDPQVLKEWLVELIHPVGLTELYGIAVAFALWRPLLLGRRVIVFCDNWTAIDVYIKGSSHVTFLETALTHVGKIGSRLRQPGLDGTGSVLKQRC